MLIAIKNLLGLTVITELNVKIGVIKDVELFTDSHTVRNYVVACGWFKTKTLYISPGQVKKITAINMVVDSNIEKELIRQNKKSVAPRPELGGAVSRNLE